MKTAVDIVTQLTRALLLDDPRNFDDPSDQNTQRLLSCMNRAAEDLSIMYPWSSQIKECIFLHTSLHNNYSLNQITDDAFDRFATDYIYNATQKKRIDEITQEQLISEQISVLPHPQCYFRQGDNILLFGDMQTKDELHFYYQCKWVCYNPTRNEYKTEFTEEDDVPYHDPRLLLRATVVKYKREAGLDFQTETQEFQSYFERIKDNQGSKAIIGLDRFAEWRRQRIL